MAKQPSLEEALNEIKTKPLTTVPTMSAAFGISTWSGYAALNRGEIEFVQIGALKKPICAPLRKKLGIDA